MRPVHWHAWVLQRGTMVMVISLLRIHCRMPVQHAMLLLLLLLGEYSSGERGMLCVHLPRHLARETAMHMMAMHHLNLRSRHWPRCVLREAGLHMTGQSCHPSHAVLHKHIILSGARLEERTDLAEVNLARVQG
jgi:hypothetical protein